MITDAELIHLREVAKMDWESIAEQAGRTVRPVQERYKRLRPGVVLSSPVRRVNPRTAMRRCLGCPSGHLFRSPHPGIRMCQAARERPGGDSPFEPDGLQSL